MKLFVETAIFLAFFIYCLLLHRYDYNNIGNCYDPTIIKNIILSNICLQTSEKI